MAVLLDLPAPTRHRRYCYRQIQLGSYKEKWTHSRDTVGRPFWDELSLRGRRVDVDTGRHLVRRVLRMADAHPGEPIDHLPDLLIEWDRGASTRPKTGTIRDQWTGNRTGDHQASGLLITAGPGLGPERFSSAVDVTQIGATIAALLGVTLADGTSLPVREPLSEAGALKR